MPDAAELAIPSATRLTQRHAYGVASLALGSAVWLSYTALIVSVALIVFAVPSSLIILAQFADNGWIGFVLLLSRWGLGFALFGVGAVVVMIAFVLFVCASALSVLGLVYGAVSLRQRERRAFAVTGILLSAVVLAFNLALCLWAATS